ncbi:MAG: Probable low-affinity inorganic phosphate transporter, partial [uncultured Gemmatimonadaceae bacterium]
GHVHHRDRGGRVHLRLHQRLPRLGELHRHDRRDARPQPVRRGGLGGRVQLLGDVRRQGGGREGGGHRLHQPGDRRPEPDARRPPRRDHLEPDHVVLRHPLELVARAHRRARGRGARQGGLHGDHLGEQVGRDALGHRALADDRDVHGLPAHGRRPQRVPARVAGQRRPLLPPRAARELGAPLARARRQRRAEDDGDHRRPARRPVRAARLRGGDRDPPLHVRRPRRRHAPAVGRARRLHGDLARHAVRRLADRAHDGLAHHAPPAGRGLLRRDGRGDRHPHGVAPRDPREHHAHHHRVDRRRGRDQPAARRALGARGPDRLGVDRDDPRVGAHGRDLVLAAEPVRGDL